MALTREDIIRAGMAILDAYGLADLTMRRVADELGVQAGALYYHVPNKQSLLSGLADEILGHLGDSQTLAEWARDYRRSLLEHRDGAELVAATRATRLGRVDPTKRAMEILPDADVVATFEYFVLGATLHDQTQSQLAELGVVDGFDQAAAEARFHRGVAILEAGTETAPE